MSQHELEKDALLKSQAAQYFNQTWDLLDKQNRSPQEDLQMIHQAHASRFLWGLVGKDKQKATGEWQVSRVYAVLKMGESSLYHAQASLDYCEKGALTPFDFAFAHEALARAYAVLKKPQESLRQVELGRESANKVQDDEERAYVLSELQGIAQLLV